MPEVTFSRVAERERRSTTPSRRRSLCSPLEHGARAAFGVRGRLLESRIAGVVDVREGGHADGRALGDTTTLADANVVAKLKEQYAEE